MRILITGGAGYVGNALVQQLSQDESVEQIHIYDNLSRGREVFLQHVVRDEKIKFTEAEILDNYTLKAALQKIDVVVHLATVQRDMEHHYMEQLNHWGTVNICNLVEEYPIKRFVFLSTSEVYGNTAEKKITASLENPQTPYAKSMLRAEKYIRTLSNKCEVAIVRAASVYGYNPAMHFNTGLNRHIFDAKYNEKLQLDADGLHMQSAIHIADLTKLLTQLTLKSCQQSTYLVGTENWTGMGIYEELQVFYPELEATFSGHHLRLADQVFQTDEVSQSMIKEKTPLAKAIKEIIEKTNY